MPPSAFGVADLALTVRPVKRGRAGAELSREHGTPPTRPVRWQEVARGSRLTVDLVVAHLDGLGDGGVDEGHEAKAARLHGGAVTDDVRVRDLAKLLLEVAPQRVLRAVVREPAEEDLARIDFAHCVGL